MYYNLRLRAVEESDLKFLYELRQDEDIIKNLKFFWPISMYGQKEWIDSIQNDSKNKILIIEKTLNGVSESIGNARIQNIDHFNRVSEIGLDLHKDFRGKGYGKLAFKKIIDLCFNDLNMRKLYLHVFSFNKTAISVYLKNGFMIEGTLKDHLFKNGKYETLLIMSKFNGKNN